MKKIKIIIPIIVILLLCGCNNEVDEQAKIDSNYWVYCDKKYGIEYIQYGLGYHGGLTVRLNENGEVIHCEK